jgi:hypothetical protein
MCEEKSSRRVAKPREENNRAVINVFTGSVSSCCRCYSEREGVDASKKREFMLLLKARECDILCWFGWGTLIVILELLEAILAAS